MQRLLSWRASNNFTTKGYYYLLKNTDKNNKIGYAPQLLTEDIGQGKIDGFGKTSTEGKGDSIDSYKLINFYTFYF